MTRRRCGAAGRKQPRVSPTWKPPVTARPSLSPTLSQPVGPPHGSLSSVPVGLPLMSSPSRPVPPGVQSPGCRPGLPNDRLHVLITISQASHFKRSHVPSSGTPSRVFSPRPSPAPPRPVALRFFPSAVPCGRCLGDRPGVRRLTRGWHPGERGKSCRRAEDLRVKCNDRSKEVRTAPSPPAQSRAPVSDGCCHLALSRAVSEGMKWSSSGRNEGKGLPHAGSAQEEASSHACTWQVGRIGHSVM